MIAALWQVPLFLALVPLSIGVFLALRPTWPVGEVVVDSPNPVAAPISGQPVCAYHLVVEHPGGSTSLDRIWADPIEARAPDGVSGAIEPRWSAPEPTYQSLEGETRTGGVLLPTESKRVTSRCIGATTCSWTERLIPCGSSHRVRWDTDGRTVNVERAEPGLEGAATTWILGAAIAALLMLSGFLRLLMAVVSRVRG